MSTLEKDFESYLSDKFGRKIKVDLIREIPGGFLSRAFVLSCTDGSEKIEFFARTIASDRGGYVYPIDRYRSFYLSDLMYTNASQDVRSHGLMIRESGQGDQYDAETFHIQDYKPGTGYIHEYYTLAQKSTLSEEDKRTIRAIARKLWELHLRPVPESTMRVADDLYVRGYRELIINPEIMFEWIDKFPADHSVFGHGEKKYGYLTRMIREYDRMIQKKDPTRLRCLHGDFWAANILLDAERNPFLIDYSRIPYGDPGIDIGWFVGNCMIDLMKTGNEIYREVAITFTDEYIKTTKDADILQHSVLPIFWNGIINLFPPIFWECDPVIIDRILRLIFTCADNGKILLDYLPENSK